VVHLELQISSRFLINDIDTTRVNGGPVARWFVQKTEDKNLTDTVPLIFSDDYATIRQLWVTTWDAAVTTV
jgi:hypothetical protein